MKCKPLKANSKIHRILRELARGRSLNTFEAQDLGDTCLNSTVDRLQHYGLRIHREQEAIRGRFGVALVCRYSLPADQLETAQRLLGDVPTRPQ